MGDSATMTLFLLPAAIALLGIVALGMAKKPAWPVLVVAGIFWWALSIFYWAQSAGPADVSNILAWISAALGFVFVFAPLTWMRESKKEDPTLEEAEQEEQPSYGEKMEDWEKRSGLRNKSQRAEDRAARRERRGVA